MPGCQGALPAGTPESKYIEQHFTALQSRGELCSDLYHTHILENFLKILVKVSFFVVLNRFWHVYGGKMVPRAC